MEENLVFLTNIYAKPPESGAGIRLAIYQGERPVGTKKAVKANLERLQEIVLVAKKYDVQLISFPELYLTGYALSPKMVKELAQANDGPAIIQVGELAKQHRMGIVFPYAEVAVEQGKNYYYDSIALIAPNGELLQNYRKTHLFGESERINWSFGVSDYPVNKINNFPVGILNCYEAEFPELSRILALKGAKLIVIPTAADYYYTLPNGKVSEVPYPDISKTLIPANAYHNDLFVAYSNRMGYEYVGKKQWHYRGNSIISGPHGDIVAAADHNKATLLIADLLPNDYGQKHPEPANYLENRRPELYDILTSDDLLCFSRS